MLTAVWIPLSHRSLRIYVEGVYIYSCVGHVLGCPAGSPVVISLTQFLFRWISLRSRSFKSSYLTAAVTNTSPRWKTQLMVPEHPEIPFAVPRCQLPGCLPASTPNSLHTRWTTRSRKKYGLTKTTYRNESKLSNENLFRKICAQKKKKVHKKLNNPPGTWKQESAESKTSVLENVGKPSSTLLQQSNDPT